MVPVCNSAQECNPPAVIAAASVMRLTCTGNGVSLVVPLPSWPQSLLPQQDIVPSSWSEQECWLPAVMAVASVMSGTATGAEYLSVMSLLS